MAATKPTTIEIDMQQLDDVLRRVEANELTEEDCRTIRTLFASYVHLTELLQNKNTSLARLRKLLFGASTEKTAAVLGGKDACSPGESSASPATAAEAGAEAASSSATSVKNAENAAKKGHGRNASDAYAKAERIEPAFEELMRQAADGEVVHNDDTTVKILELMEERAKEPTLAEDAAGDDDAPEKKPERRGMFTSGVVSTKEGRRIALFLSGRQHAGENLHDVLSRRAATLAAPIQMCDALTRNLPGELETILAHCLAHGRRRFVEVADRFPEQCRYVLESLAAVYRNDAVARQRKLSPSARRHFHQMESGPVMEQLRAWLSRQLEDRLVEPNSSLGAAISYMLKHWERLTLFLRVPGAPLDNNVCERALKKAQADCCC